MLLVVAGIVLGACDVLESRDRSNANLEFDAELMALRSDTIQFVLGVRNPSEGEVVLSSGGCLRSAALLVYEPPHGSGPVWDERAWVGDGPCFSILYRYSIPGGERISIPRAVPTSYILGDSLPAGPYRLSAVLDFHQTLDRDELPLGEVVLESTGN